MVAIALALASSLSWGVADFLAGIKSRTLPVLTVLALSQAAGLVTIAAIVAVRGEGPPGHGFALYAALAALGGTGGLAAFYRGLAVGVMAVVAPISSTAACVPVVYGVATGERPSAAQVAGIVLAIVGVALASREEVAERRGAAPPPPRLGVFGRPNERFGGGRTPPNRNVAAGVAPALVAAAGFGSFFVLMNEAAGRGDALWAILVNRATGASAVAGLALALGARGPRGARELGTLAGIGVLDMSANALYALATTKGLVSVVAVLASLYPVVVVALASALLRERIRRSQRVGVAAALAGVALISAG